MAISRTPADEYLLVEDDGSVYGVLVDRRRRPGVPRPAHWHAAQSGPDVPRGLVRRPPRPAARRGVGAADRQKGRRHNFGLVPGKRFFSNRGHLEHDELIGREEGFTVTSSAGGEYLVFRPLLSEFVVSMPRGAAVVYPKDAAQIVAMADIFPGAHVVEAGRRLRCADLLAAARRRPARPGVVLRAARGVRRRRPRATSPSSSGATTRPGRSRLGDLAEALPASGERADRIILDMLAPWECVDAVADALRPAASSARTSPPRPSCPGSSRRCACTAASPSRTPGSRWCATGTSRASPCAPATR